MKIKRKEYERLKSQLAYYERALNGTRLVIEVPGTLGPEAGPHDIPPMVPVVNVNLENMIMIARFGGYDNHVGEVLTGPFAIRFLTDDPLTGYERFLYHRFMQDGRTVITTTAAYCEPCRADNHCGKDPCCSQDDAPFNIINTITLRKDTPDA